jgi:hypothetical protein
VSQFIVADLDFIETRFAPVAGGASIVPPISTSLSTAAGTRAITGLTISGNAIDGFDIVAIGIGQGAGAAAGAASIGGIAKTRVIVRPFGIS